MTLPEHIRRAVAAVIAALCVAACETTPLEPSPDFTGDMVVSIGTSGAVWPAAGFVEIARAAGAQTVEFDLAPTSGSHRFDLGLYGPATQTLPPYLDTLRAEKSGPLSSRP